MEIAEKPRQFDRLDLLPNRLADFLREEIVSGRLAPGERLPEQALAERCQVSRVPLREAFRILSAEGLIVLSPHRGASVAALSEGDLVDLFEARAAIESHACGLAATVASNDVIKPLHKIVADMRRAVSDGDITTYYALANDFHTGLIAASGNAVLFRMYEQIRRQLRRYQAAMSRMPELPRRSIAEHARILKAIDARDARAAQEAAADHIRGLVEQFKALDAPRPAKDKRP
jgi:DNA-binding GntR family transcriptional regulator